MVEIQQTEAHLEPCQASMSESFFAKIVNSFYPLTIYAVNLYHIENDSWRFYIAKQEIINLRVKHYISRDQYFSLTKYN